MNTSVHISNISKKLGSREVLKGVSFDVYPGDMFGYLGPNGAGKTTTIRILLGLLQADSGELNILGQDIKLPGTRMKIGFALDPDGLYNGMTGKENLEFFAAIYQTGNAKKHMNKVLGLVGLSDRDGDMVGTYSKGMRQRLSLARAIAHNPEVLILDEPTAGVDPAGQIEIRNILIEITRVEKKTVLLSSHNLDEVQRICNRIAIIDRGEIKLYGNLSHLRHQLGHGGIFIETDSTITDDVLKGLAGRPEFGFSHAKGNILYFEPGDEHLGIADFASFLASMTIKIERIGRREASLEDIYAGILQKAEEE